MSKTSLPARLCQVKTARSRCKSRDRPLNVVNTPANSHDQPRDLERLTNALPDLKGDVSEINIILSPSVATSPESDGWDTLKAGKEPRRRERREGKPKDKIESRYTKAKSANDSVMAKEDAGIVDLDEGTDRTTAKRDPAGHKSALAQTRVKPCISHASVLDWAEPPNNIPQPIRPEAVAQCMSFISQARPTCKSRVAPSKVKDVSPSMRAGNDIPPLAECSSFPANSHSDSSSSQKAAPVQEDNLRTTTRASLPIPLHFTPRLPDLLSIKPCYHPPGLTDSTSLTDATATKPFPLYPPPYTDEDVPLPEPYNPAYPHPLTAYASPGTNPATVHRSGYDKILIQLLRTDPNKVKGSILAWSAYEDVPVPSLALPREGEGNGIPERLWSRFESFGVARLPLGIAGVSPYSRPASKPFEMAPRFSYESTIGPSFFSDSGAKLNGQEIPGSHAPLFAPPQHRSNGCVPFENDSRQQMRHARSANVLNSYRLPFQSNMNRRYSDDVTLFPQPPAANSNTNRYQLGPEPTSSHKTELCRDRHEQAICRHGMHCQDLHFPLCAPLPLFTFIGDRDDQSFQDPYAIFDTPVDATRIATRLGSEGTQSRIESRRVSASPPVLLTVAEVDDDTRLPSPYSGLSGSAVAPIGAERSSPPKTDNPKFNSSSGFGQASLESSQRNLDIGSGNMITLRGSSTSNLSTSTSSRCSLSTNSSEPISIRYGLIDAEVGMPYAVHRPRRDGSLPQNLTGSATFDFSTGKSIWCS